MADYDVRAVFEQMELELIASMKRNLSRHQKWEKDEKINWTMWQVEQLKTLENFKKENKEIFGAEFTNINNEIAKFLKETYKTAGFEQERLILEQLSKGNKVDWKQEESLSGGFFSLNEKKINALINATTSDMKKAEHAMLRMINDQYRKTIFRAQTMANSGAFTLKQSIDAATKDFLKAGINCIEYKDGRRVNIATYAEMAVRTANKRAMLQSEGEVRNAYDVHTVRISKYGGCSETCLPWQGRVYVDDIWSGGTKEEAKEKNLPLLSEAVDNGLFHPICKHRSTTYFPELEEAAEDVDDSGFENPIEEQEHRKNHLLIQQQKRLETGSLDPKNVAEAKQRKKVLIEKDKDIWSDDYFLQMIKQADAKRKAKPVLKKEMPDKFTGSNSLSEAVDFMKVYSKYDKHEVDDSFKLDIINGFNESAYNVKKRYGRDLDISGIERMPEGRRDQAAYSPTSKKITLKNSNLTTLKKNAIKNYKSDWNASDDVYSVFYHEIGHSVWEDLSLSAQFEIASLYKDTKKAAYDEWVAMGGNKSTFKKEEVFGLQLSRYGAKNEKEFFSEAFSQIMSGIDTDIAEKIDDILMRKYADKSVVKTSLNDKIKIEIDEITPCLRRVSDNKIVDTYFVKGTPTKKSLKDWEFDWSKEEDTGFTVMQLFAKGDDRIQGLISTRPRKDMKAIEVNVVESSPFNNPHNKIFKNKEYTGIGGHLFAEAVRQSYKEGFDGFVVFKAKTNLIEHYKKELGAILFNPKDRMMCIDERSAKILYERYFKK